MSSELLTLTDPQRQQLLDESYRLLKKGQNQEALVLLDGLGQAFPSNEDIVSTRVYCLGALGRLEEARGLCGQLPEHAHSRKAKLSAFLDGRELERTRQAAAENSAPPSPASLQDTRSIIGSRDLSLKLEGIVATMETEFRTFQKRDQKAGETIKALRRSLAAREKALELSLHQSTEFERELFGLREEFSVVRKDLVNAQTITDQTEEVNELLAAFDERSAALTTTAQENEELRASIDALSAVRDTAGAQQSDLEASVETIANLKSKLQTLETDLSGKDTALKESLSKRAEFESAAAALTEELGASREVEARALRNDLTKAQTVADQTEEVNELLAALDERGAALTTAAQENEELRASIDALSVVRDTAGAQQSDLEASVEKIANLKSKLQALETDLSGKTTAFKESLSKKVEFESAVAVLTEELEASREVEARAISRNASLESQAGAGKAYVAELEKSLRKTELDYRSVHEDLAAKEQEIMRLCEGTTGHERAALDLEQRLEAGDAARAVAVEERDALSAERDRLAAELSEQGTQLEEVAERARTAEERAGSLTLEIDALVSHRDELEAAHTSLNTDLADARVDWEGAKTSLADDVKARSEELSVSEQNLRATESELVTLERRVVELEQGTEALRERAETLESERVERTALLEQTEELARTLREECDASAREAEEARERIAESKTAHADLSAAREELEERIGGLEEKLEAAAATSSELERVLCDVRGAEEAAREELAQAAAREKLAAEEMGEHAAQLLAVERERKFLEDEFKSMQLALEEFASTETRLRVEGEERLREIEDGRATIRGLEQEGESLRADLSETRTRAGELDLKLEAVTQQSADLNKTLGLQETALSSATAVGEELKSSVSSLEEEVANLRSAGDAASDQIRDLEAGLGERDDSLSNAAMDRAALRDELAELHKHIDELQQSERGQAAEIESLHAKQRSNEADLSELHNERAELESALKDSDREKEDLLVRKAETEADLASVRKALSEANDRIRDAEKNIVLLVAEKASIEEERDNVSREKRDATARIKVLEEDVSTRDNRLALMTQDRDEFESAALRLETEIDVVRSEKAAAIVEADETGRSLAAQDVKLEAFAKEKTKLSLDLGVLEEELEHEGELRRELLAAKGLVEDSLEEKLALITDAERAQDELEKSLMELNQNLTELGERERQANEQNESLSQDVVKRGEQIAALAKEKQKVERERLATQELLDEERARGELLRGQLENARNGLGEWRNKHVQAASKRDEHAARVAKLEEELVESEGRADLAEEVGARLAQTIAKRDVEVETLSGERSGLQHEVAELRTEIGNLSELGRKADSEISALNQNLSETERQLAVMEEGKRDADTNLADLGREYTGLQAEATATAAALGHLEDRHANLVQREKELTVRVTKVEKSFKEKEAALNQAEAGLEELRTKDLPEALEQKIRAFRETMDLRAEVELLRSQLW